MAVVAFEFGQRVTGATKSLEDMSQYIRCLACM